MFKKWMFKSLYYITIFDNCALNAINIEQFQMFCNDIYIWNLKLKYLKAKWLGM